MLKLAQSSCFTFRFEQSQDVSLTNWSLNIADDSTGWVVEELDLHLRTLSLRSCASQNLDNASQNDWFFHFFYREESWTMLFDQNSREKEIFVLKTEQSRRQWATFVVQPSPRQKPKCELEKIVNSPTDSFIEFVVGRASSPVKSKKASNKKLWFSGTSSQKLHLKKVGINKIHVDRLVADRNCLKLAPIRQLTAHFEFLSFAARSWASHYLPWTFIHHPPTEKCNKQRRN